jgi:hypothetical protein
MPTDLPFMIRVALYSKVSYGSSVLPVFCDFDDDSAWDKWQVQNIIEGKIFNNAVEISVISIDIKCLKDVGFDAHKL